MTLINNLNLKLNGVELDEVLQQIYNILKNSTQAEQQSELFDLLGFDNIEQIEQLISNRNQFLKEYDQQQNEDIEKIIDMFIQVSCYSRQRAIEFLNKHNFNLNDAMDDFYDRQKGLQFITQDGKTIPREDIDEYYERIEDYDDQQLPNDVKVIDYQRIQNSAYHQYELDLHGYGYQDAIEKVMLKINELVFKLQDINKNGAKVQLNLKIITGRGMHSQNNPVIKYGVEKLLKENNIPYKVLEETKGGAIMVKIKPNQQTL